MDNIRHPEGQDVSAQSDVAIAEDWVEILETVEARRLGVTRAEARPKVARSIGVPEGKLYSLARRRLKDISNRMLRRIGDGLVRELQAELARVEHDLQIRTQIGDRPDSGEALSLASRREKIREALGIAASDGGDA